MSRSVMVVLSNPTSPDVEEEFNDWYNNAHLADVLAVDGVMSATRYRLSDGDARAASAPYRYLAIYELESDDVAGVAKRIGEAAASGAMGVARAFDISGALVNFFAPLTERLTKDDSTALRASPRYAELRQQLERGP